MKLKRIFGALLLVCVCTISNAQKIVSDSLFDNKLNFYIVNDIGRNGYYDQKPIAEKLGELAEYVDPEFVVAAGDVHHFDGVQSINDPLWMTNYELVYSHPDLMLAWYPILGNHEYRGNTQSVIDYSNVSRRWEMDSRYYTKAFENDGMTIRIVWIDTTPLIDKYRNDSETYPDAGKQDMEAQLSWLNNTLSQAKEDWVIVVGHHPIYAETSKSDTERADMQKRVDSILRKYKVDMYVCGHIHNFQHIRVNGSNIDYVVNTAGALSRKVAPTEGTVFCSPATGFSICSATKSTLELRMVDKDGNIIHTITRTK